MIVSWVLFIKNYVLKQQAKLKKLSFNFFVEKLSINLYVDPEFIHELLSLQSSSEELLAFTQIDLSQKKFIQRIFKKEYALFKVIEKEKSLFDAYQICFSLQKQRKEFEKISIKPLVYPFFLYVLAWLLLLSLITYLIPSIQKQMPILKISVPSEIILLIFGLQCGLIILFVLDRKSVV